MEIKEYFSCADGEKYLAQIELCDWSAAKFLTEQIKNGSLAKLLGGWAELYLLVDGDALVSFATLSCQDCIDDKSLTPWIGFFHTAPKYRNRRLGQVLLDYICKAAARRFNKIYLATDHIGLYEKYGFSYVENRIDVFGEDSRIYMKNL